MPAAYVHERAAYAILEWLAKAEANLVGKVASTHDGHTGSVEDLKLDGQHGLCFRFADDVPDRYHPTSTIRYLGP